MHETTVEAAPAASKPSGWPAKSPAVVRRPVDDPLRVPLRLAVLVALYGLPLLITVRPVGRPIFDPDVWWHLRTGQWIYEHRALPTTDPFSQYGQDRPWVAYSWLFELGIYGLYSLFGLAGIIVYRAVMALAITAALHRFVLHRDPRFLPAALWTGIALLPLCMLMSERPWLFTILFTTLTLGVVLHLRDGGRRWVVWLLPAVFVVWVNVHIQFVYGLVVLAVGVVAPLIDRRLRHVTPGSGASQARSPAWRRLTTLAGLCFLATFVNPYGYQLYVVVAEYATQPGPFTFVNELKAPEFRAPGDWVVLAMTVAAAFVIGRRRSTGSFEILLLAGATVLSFHARRDYWLVVLAGLTVLARGPRAALLPGQRFALTWPRVTVVAAALVVLTAVLVKVRELDDDNLKRTVAGVFPVDAARFINDQGCKGALYNDFNWGGYLIWALPEHPVAVDGRTNLHGDERLLRFGSTCSGLVGWQDDPELAAAGVVVADSTGPLAGLLAHDCRFQLAYKDSVATVFLKRSR